MNLLTPNGWKDINDVNVGDDLVAYDVNTGQEIVNQLLSKQLLTVQEEEATFYRINGTWTLYKNQSVWVDGRVEHAFNLKSGDTVYNGTDADVAVTTVEEVTGTEWWRLEVSGDHSYIADDLTLHNASRYWVGGGSSTNWNATANTNWGSSSGVQDNSSVPTSADDVVFDGAGVAGNSNSTISATITVLSLNITSGYSATMTHNAVLTISGGNCTLNSTYTIAGTSALTFSGGGTFKSNGKTWPNNFNLDFGGTATKVLDGNFTISGQLSVSLNLIWNALTTATLTVAGGLSILNSLSGTIDLVLTGGTWSAANNTARVSTNTVTIAGNVTMGTNVVVRQTTLIYSSGTVTTTGSTLTVQSPSTLNTNGIIWNNATFIFGVSVDTITLTSDFTCTGTLINPGPTSTTINRTTTEIVSCGGITVNGIIQGTAKIILTGGTWSGTNTSGIANSLDIQGNITISSNVYYLTGTLKYVSGTITTIGSTLNITGSCTLNANGISWNNITFNGSTTCTLISNLTINGLLSILGNTIINKTISETVTCAGGMTINAKLSGNTVEVILTGGTWSGTNITSGINITLNGNVTVSGIVSLEVGTLKYLSGTITTTGSTLNCYSGGITLDTAGVTWNNVSFGPFNSGATLTSDFVATGTLSSTTGSSVGLNTATGKTFRVKGITTNPSGINGTATFILTGGNWVGTIGSTNFQLDGNVTVSGTVSITGCTLKYVSGTITTTGSTLSVIDACSLDTNGVTWNNVTYPNTLYSENLSSLLSVSGTLTIGTAGINFIGSGGWSCGTLTNASTSAATITLKDGNTYTVTGAMNVFQSRSGSPVLFTSSHASNRAILTLRNPSSCNCLASFTRIDASQGRTVTAFMGTVTDCLNVISYNDMRPVAA